MKEIEGELLKSEIKMKEFLRSKTIKYFGIIAVESCIQHGKKNGAFEGAERSYELAGVLFQQFVDEFEREFIAQCKMQACISARGSTVIR